MKYYKKLSFTLLLLTCTVIARSQFNISSYQLQEALPQSNLFNPAIMPDNKVVVGIPGISSFYAKLETTLSASDLFVRGSNDSLVVNTSALTNNNYRSYRINAITDAQIFLLGINTSFGYFNYNIRLRSDNRVVLPGELFRWALYGPGDERVSNTLDFEDFKARSMTYIENSIGYAYRYSSYLTFGARLKFLSGLAVMAGSQSGQLTLSPQAIDLQLQDFRYNYAGAPLDTTGGGLSVEPFSTSDIFSGNGGIALDLGAKYKPMRNLEVAASLIDIGFISWNNNVTSVTIEDVNYQFTGVDAKDFVLNNGGTFEDQQNEIDSLIQRLEPQIASTESFRTSLVGKVILSGRYLVGERSYVGATLFTDFFQGSLDPVFALNYQAKFGNIFSVMTGLAFKNRSVNNVLLGFVFKPGPFQFYLASDRLNSVFFPARADEFNIRLGMNLVFGRPSVLE